MGNSVYQINKGINKSIEFKGLKAQYIWWLGGGVVALLVLFAVMYFIGVNSFIGLGIVLMMGAGWVVYVYRLSNTHGEYGMMKKLAKTKVPKIIRSNSRKIFWAASP